MPRSLQIHFIFLVCIALLLFASVSCVTTYKPATCALPADTDVILSPLEDKYEPMNRAFADFNDCVVTHVVHPATQIWDVVIPDYLQARIGCFGENIGYPMRVVNHLLQAEWGMSWVDTKRFGINMTAGVLGFWDPATGWGAPHIAGNFSQTLRGWHTPGGDYVNAPVFGPGNVRDLAGSCVDTLLEPSRWFLPTGTNLALNCTLGVNKFNQEMPSLVNILKSNNSYELSKIAGVFTKEAENSRYVIDRTRNDYDADQTLGALLTAPRDARKMYAAARNRKAKLADGSKVPYTCWNTRNAKAIVVILPGIGGNRHSDTVYAIAEQFIAQGNCSVIALSSTFSADYFENLVQPAPPGYLPEDAKRLALVISAALEDYTSRYKDNSSAECVILGYSLGALNTLHLAALEKNGLMPENIHVKKYVAINPPVHVAKALGKIDQFFALPNEWPSATRRAQMQDMALRLGAYFKPSVFNPPSPVVPLTRTESQFLIGMYMRAILADTVVSWEKNAQIGLFRNDVDAHFYRNDLFLEAMAFSYTDYMLKAVLPWYQSHLNEQLDAQKMEARADLTALEDELHGDARIHVFQNRNDFLIAPEDVAWYERCFGDNLHLFEQGGHLGNLAFPDYQQLLLKIALEK